MNSHTGSGFIARFGVRRTLTMGFGLITALLIALGVFAIYELNMLSDEMAELDAYGLAGASNVGRAQSAMWELRYGISQYIAVPDPESRQKIRDIQDSLYKTIDQNMAQYLAAKRTPEEQRLAAEFMGWYKKYAETRPRWLELYGAGNIQEAAEWRSKTIFPFGGSMVKAFDALFAEQQRHAQVEAAELRKHVERNRLIVIGMGVAVAAAVLLSVLLAWGISRSLSRGMNVAVDDLQAASQQTVSASNQIAQSSQSLAEGSSEQAAGIEESSSTLEEISALTKQNAENAAKAAGMVQEVRTRTERGSVAIGNMVERIVKISDAAGETAKIVKTIDEIAFQTNLLALNAAVEAARAGDAGRGFAVVAEEVRNLAMRAASAAKDTSTLIADSQEKAQQGVSASAEGKKLLEEILTGVNNVQALVSDVAAANQEQYRGITQISTAITQLNQVVQSNSANAEETASAGVELSHQAKALDNVVIVLRSLVNGRESDGQNRQGATSMMLAEGSAD